MDLPTLGEAASEVAVFARVAPEHKLRLVRVLEDRGAIVAMTGDGVNDAPALKQANIGVAMGITGSSVAKEAADVVLTDDDFATIVAAVEEGRRVYDNLVKSLAFVLPTNLGLALILVFAVLFLPFDPVTRLLLMPIEPRQILWINLVATIALALPLAFEAKEPDIMQRKPRDPDEPILSRFVVRRTLFAAMLMTAAAIGVFLFVIGRGGTDAATLSLAQTMAVTTVIFFQIFYVLGCRSLRDSIFRIGVFTNPYIYLGIAVLLGLQAAFIYAPRLGAVFLTTPLDIREVGICALAGLSIQPFISLEKWLGRTRRRRAQRLAHA
jgi:Ca2+-transporting ATPase